MKLAFYGGNFCFFMMCNYCFIRRKTNYYLKICYFYTFFLNLYARDTENFVIF